MSVRLTDGRFYVGFPSAYLLDPKHPSVRNGASLALLSRYRGTSAVTDQHPDARAYGQDRAEQATSEPQCAAVQAMLDTIAAAVRGRASLLDPLDMPASRVSERA